MKFDHIGWTTNNIEKFESFWCGVLGFVLEAKSSLTPEMAKVLFDIESPAVEIRRYRKDTMVVEIHAFPEPALAHQRFDRFGISHMCLHVDNREDFLASLPSWVAIRKYKNPKGWDNVFILDAEKNIIEVRTTL